MKKLIPLSAFAIILLFGCVKEETMFAVNENQQVEKSIAYVFNLDGDSPTWEQVTPDELSSTPGSSSSVSTRDNNGNSAHTHGSINGIGNWSGTENNGGPHGSAFFQLGISEVTMETECVMVDGNEAVYGGTITELVNPSGPLAVGGHLYLKVIDNGQGNNAPADEWVPAILYGGSSRCGIYTPDFFLWDFFGTLDVEDPGSVKVNN